MDPWYPIKEEFTEMNFAGEVTAVIPAPQPMEGLHEIGPPPFLTKTYEMVDDPAVDQIVSWNRQGNSFVVWNPDAFSTTLLPRYFKHSNFSSFVRQLNTYGFRKVDPDKWEFATEEFLRGQRHLLKNIKRRRTSSSSSSSSSHQALPIQPNAIDHCVEVGRFGVDGEVDRLKRDKQVLMMELVKLRQQQQNTRTHLQAMEHRINSAEMKQQHMMNFLARAMKNPAFLEQLVQKKEMKELEEELNKKRRRPIDQGAASSSRGIIKAEPLELGGYQVSELEALAMEIQGFGRHCQEDEDGQIKELCSAGKEIDEEFLEELLSESLEENEYQHNLDDENVSNLADKLGYLG